MKRMIYFILLLILAAGCSREAELVISNETPVLMKVSIDGYIHDLPAGGEPVKEIFYLNSYLLFGETVKVPVEYIQTTPFRSYKKINVEMKPGMEKKLAVRFDRGQLELWNLSTVPIYAITICKTGDDEWSENLISEVLLHEDSAVIPIKSGSYLMKLVDPSGFEFDVVELEIIAGETLTFWFWE